MRILLLLIFCLNFSIGFSQQLENLVPEVEQRPRQITDTLGRNYDQRDLQVHPFPENINQRYSSAEFNYQDTTTDGSNFITDFFEWLFGSLGNLFGFEISPLWIMIIKWAVYAIFGGLVIYILARLFHGQSASGIRARSKKNLTQIYTVDSQIEDLDFQELTHQSIAAGNYRNGIRYLYLQTLKLLNGKGIIAWDYQKTNRDYYYEIKDQQLREQFQKVSHLYDYVWYGEFVIDEHAFAKARTQFDSINNTII